jgi:hypothetical protein
VIPSIFCWVVTLYPSDAALPMLFAGLAVALVVDWLLYRDTPVPRWFLTLRSVLTGGALLAVGASWVAMATRLGVAR